MTTRKNGPRVLTPRKKRLWTVQTITMGLVAGNVDVAFQRSVDVGAVFATQTGLVLRDATVGRVFINGVYSMIPAASPVVVSLFFGLIVGQDTLVVTDFPDLSLGSGDYFVRDARTALEVDDNIPGDRPLEPQGIHNGGGSIMVDGKSKRTVRRVGEIVFMVAQKNVATEQVINLSAELTILWLY